MANQYKFVGTDNSTTGGALTPFGSGNPLVSETYVIKSILVTAAGTPTVTVTNNSITAIKSAALTQMRSLEKAKELSNLGYGTFSTEDQQKLDQLQKMDADQSKTYSMII